MAEMIERLCTFETGLEISPFRQLPFEQAQLINDLKRFKHVKGYRWSHNDCVQGCVSVEELLKYVPLTKENFEYLKMNSVLLRDWIPGQSLMDQRIRYVAPLFTRWINSTNGLAAGNEIEEAIIHGFCEIIERWALVHFIRSEHRGYPSVDLNTIEDSEIQDMLAYFESNGIEVTVKDLTQDGQFPVYAIITRNTRLTPKFVGYNTIKAGCHFDANMALKRAFTERMQGTSFEDERAFGFIDKNQTDLLMPLYLQGICMFDLKDHIPGDTVPMRDFTYECTHDALAGMKNIANILGTDIVVVDHTHPEIKFPVVRVVMPGISDFIPWWEPKKITLNFLGNIMPEDDEYEENLHRFLKTFVRKK